MLELNKVMLVGNLTRDPEIKYLPSGTAVADLGLAVNRRWFDRNAGEKKEETLFVDVTVWDKSAEFCKNYLHKGSAIIVEGRLKQDTWQDKQTGTNRSKLTVVAERIQFADSKGGQQSGELGVGEAPGSGQPEPASYSTKGFADKPVSEVPSGPGKAGNTEDDLPF
jgi:single-strand DNA-binding protein